MIFSWIIFTDELMKHKTAPTNTNKYVIWVIMTLFTREIEYAWCKTLFWKKGLFLKWH